MLFLDESRLRAIGLRRFADRLIEIVRADVRPPVPINPETLRRAVLNQFEIASAYGLSSEADYALYLLTAFCFNESFHHGELGAVIRDPFRSTDEKRVALNTAFAEADYMDYGALESEAPQPKTPLATLAAT